MGTNIYAYLIRISSSTKKKKDSFINIFCKPIFLFKPFLDRKDGIIYNQNEIAKKINSNFVSFSFSDLDNIFDNLNYIIKNNLSNSKSLAIISCTDLAEIDDNLYKENESKELKKYVSEIDLLNYKNINSFSNSEAIILIFKLGNTKRNSFNSLMDKLKILKDKEIYSVVLS